MVAVVACSFQAVGQAVARARLRSRRADLDCRQSGVAVPRTEYISGIVAYSGSGSSLPSAPRMTTGLPS
jgi:hypothetical protein